MTELFMPSLGADMDAGALVEQRKRAGEVVRRGDIFAAVETDKGVIEIEAFHDGVLERWLVPVGQKVAVGTALATLQETADALPARVADEPPTRAAAAPTEEALPSFEPASIPLSYRGALSHVRMPPSARRRALELDVDADDLHGTGRHGVITRGDVEQAASRVEAAPVAASAPQTLPTSATSRRAVSPYARKRARELGVDLRALERVKPRGAIRAHDVDRASAATPASAPQRSPVERMRAAIAAAVVRSKREIPHYYVGHTIDMTDALACVARHNTEATLAARVLPIALLLRAVVRALAKVPELNAHFLDGRIEPKGAVNLGVAISLRQGGVTAPAILGAEGLGLVETMRALDDLVLRARGGGLRASELASGTITVTSLGDRGVESVTPVIFPPQVAMVGFGKIVTRPFVVDDRVLPRPVVSVTLAADHRVTDGHRGGLYLAEIERLLSHPEELCP